MDYGEIARRKCFEQIYNGLSEEDRKLYLLYSMQDRMLNSINSQKTQLDNIERKQSWWLDVSSNLAGNAIYDSFLWVASRLLRRL